MSVRRSLWLLGIPGRLRTAPQEFLFFALFFDLSRIAGIELLHLLDLIRRELAQMTDEMDERPAVLIGVVVLRAPRGHAGQTDAVLDDVVQLAIGHRLRR